MGLFVKKMFRAFPFHGPYRAVPGCLFRWKGHYRNAHRRPMGVLLLIFCVLFIFSPNTAFAGTDAARPSQGGKSGTPAAVAAETPVVAKTGKEVDAIAGISDGRISSGARLFILAIGINEYKNPRLTLKYGRTDAEAFVAAVEEHGKKIFKQIIKETVYDSLATRGTVEAVFNRITKETLPEDVFVFYYAGHGVMSKGDPGKKPEFYLALTDVTKLYGDDAMLEEKGIPAHMLRDYSLRMAAGKQLIVLDTCHAGGALESFAMHGTPEKKTSPQLARNSGITVLAAAGAAQSATEFRQLGHGVFTYALLKGLSGDADSSNSPDGRITVKKLEAYLNTKVPELIKQYRGREQNPNSFTRGDDFPLGMR